MDESTQNPSTQNPSTQKPPKKLNGKITPKQFDDFWTLYPKRNGGQGSKGKAKTKWDTLCHSKNGDAPTWRQVKGSIIRQSKSELWQKKPKYIPMPSTWLNNSRWLDDPQELQFYPPNDAKPTGYGMKIVPDKYSKSKKSDITLIDGKFVRN